MMDIADILNTTNHSKSVKLLRLRNRAIVIEFLLNTFPNKQGAVSHESIHMQLAEFLEDKEVESDEESEISDLDTYEIKAKKYITYWTNEGYLTNYFDEQGDIFYELSTHSIKAIDWLASLKKEEFIGTESKFNNILNQLKELVEFTNEDTQKRIEILEEKKLEIEQQIQRIKTGEDVKVFEEFEIIPRFNQLNQSAKELLSDFKEVEENFKDITKDIYQKHAAGNLAKSDILDFTFDALDQLKESQQGKSFYAFWSFLLNPTLQDRWDSMTSELYKALEEKGIPVNDVFLRKMKNYLYKSGQKVNKANDKMADKLSRIIRENESSKSEATKKLIQDIKSQLIAISKKNMTSDISIEIETNMGVDIPFERKLTFEQKEDFTYRDKPALADEEIAASKQLSKLFPKNIVDKKVLRKRIKDVLKEKSQTTLLEVIDTYGGLEKGLPELLNYMGIVKEFKHEFSPDKVHYILFDTENNKQIKVPEIFITQ